MTGRERMEAAFSQEGATDVPAVICYERLFARDHWSELSAYAWRCEQLLQTCLQAVV